MPQVQDQCVASDQLKRLLNEQLTEAEEANLVDHVDGCPKCQRLMEAVAAETGLWDNLPVHLSSRLRAGSSSQSSPQATEGQVTEPFLNYLNPTDHPEMLGRIGSYEVCGIVGRGSAGIVLKAFERGLNRFVAIKVLSPTLANNGAARKRFEREARAVAAVVHEHVIPIFAVDEHRGLPYIVMQYVAGASLQHRIERQGAFSAREVVRISMQIARGLAAAHAQGIIHRDIKPANILLEHGLDRALVTDFGLARVADDASETMSGVLAGTPSFMAPEQARGERIDERSDLFSLGSVMYAMCTARPPFRAETVYGMIRRICEDETRSIREINPEIPEWLAGFVAKLHSKSKEARFDSAEQAARVLSLELAHLQNPASIGAPARPWLAAPIVPRTKGRLAAARSIGAAFLTAVLAIVGASYFLQATALQKEDGDEQTQAANPENAENDVQANVNANVNADANVDVNVKSEVQVNADVRVETTSRSESRTNGKGQSFENIEERSFPAQPGGQLTVNVDFGAVEVTTGEEDQVRVRAIRKVKGNGQKESEEMVSGHQLEFVSDGRDLTVNAGFSGDHKDGESRSVDVRFEIRVPEKYNVDLKTNGGHLKVDDLAGEAKLHTSGGVIVLGTIHGPIHAHTSGGHIRLEECQSDAELRTSGGSIIAGPVQGILIAETSGGHIRLDHATGRVSAKTSGGHVEINNAEGEVEAITSGGNVKATITKQPKKDSELRTSGGNIAIRVAKDVALKIEAKTDHGRIRSPFPTDRDESDHQQSVSGNLGEGGPTLKATTNAGNVSIEFVEENDGEKGESQDCRGGDDKSCQ